MDQLLGQVTILAYLGGLFLGISLEVEREIGGYEILEEYEDEEYEEYEE